MRFLFLACAFLATVAPAAIAQDPGAALPSTTTVFGVVRDSIDGIVLPGATVQLVPEDPAKPPFSARTDAAGAFRMDSVPAGSYLAGFFHPALEDLALEPRALRVVVGVSPVRVDLGTPGPTRVLDATCPAAMRGDSTGLVIGRVTDAASGAPVPGATVQVQWVEVVIDRGLRQVRRGGSARTDERGLYALCGTPGDGTLSLVATDGDHASGTIDVPVPEGGVLRRSLAISRTNVVVAAPDSVIVAARTDSAAGPAGYLRGRARLRGVVRNGDTGLPVAGARVTVRGSGLSAVTQDDGGFALAELPAGTQVLDVRALGFGPRAIPVDLRDGDVATSRVTLDARIPVLETVRVFGEAPNVSGFADRVRRRAGHILTREDIVKMRPFDFSDVFRRIPGVRVFSSTTGRVIRYRDGCTPTIYLNGMMIERGTTGRAAGSLAMSPVLRYMASVDGFEQDIDLLVDPRTVTGVEVYGPQGAPLQFRNEGCASVVIWAGMPPQ